MKSARCYLILLSVLALAHVIGFFAFLVHKYHSLDRSKMENVRVGMTYNQVVEVLKCPPGDYSDYQGNSLLVYFIHKRRLCINNADWICNEALIDVGFDEDFIVRRIKITNVNLPEESSRYQRLKTKLGF